MTGAKMSIRWRSLILGALFLLASCGPTAVDPTSTPAPAAVPSEPLRIFWVNSYTPDDPWALQIRIGVVEALARAGYAFAEETLIWERYDLGVSSVGTLDSHREDAEAAITAIQAFGPDVLIVSDDEAARLVATAYPDTDLPIVLCGLSERIASLDGRPNVTQVMEPVHAVQAATLADTLAGGESSYLVLGDRSLSGEVKTRAAFDQLVEAEVGSPGASSVMIVDTWLRWQAAVVALADDVDFILIAHYLPLVDESGTPVSAEAMMAWMFEYSPVPVFALTETLVAQGAVGGLVASGYEQGRMAADAAMSMTLPSATHSETHGEGHDRLVLNLGATRYWGLRLPVLVPLAAEVYQRVPTAQGGQF